MYIIISLARLHLVKGVVRQTTYLCDWLLENLYSFQDANLYLVIILQMSDILETMHESQETHYDEMEEYEFLKLYDHIPPMFHCVCLLWANCSYYQHPSKMVVLLQEISNDYIGKSLSLYMYM